MAQQNTGKLNIFYKYSFKMLFFLNRNKNVSWTFFEFIFRFGPSGQSTKAGQWTASFELAPKIQNPLELPPNDVTRNYVLPEPNMQRSTLPAPHDSSRPLDLSGTSSETWFSGNESLQLHSLDANPGSSSSGVCSLQAAYVQPIRDAVFPLQQRQHVYQRSATDFGETGPKDDIVKLQQRGGRCQVTLETSGLRSYTEAGERGEDVCGLGREAKRMVPMGDPRHPSGFSLEKGDTGTWTYNFLGAYEGPQNAESCDGERGQAFGEPSQGSGGCQETSRPNTIASEPLDPETLRGLRDIDQILRERMADIFQDRDRTQNQCGAPSTVREFSLCSSADGGGDSPVGRHRQGSESIRHGRLSQIQTDAHSSGRATLGASETLPEPEGGLNPRAEQGSGASRASVEAKEPLSCTSNFKPRTSDNPGPREGIMLLHHPECLREWESEHSSRSSSHQPSGSPDTHQEENDPASYQVASKDGHFSGDRRSLPGKILQQIQGGGAPRHVGGPARNRDVAQAADSETFRPTSSSKIDDGRRRQPCNQWLRLNSLPKLLQNTLRKVSNLEDFNEVWTCLKLFAEKKCPKDVKNVEQNFENVVHLIRSKCFDSKFLLNTIAESAGWPFFTSLSSFGFMCEFEHE
jgi:hypothetical protein